MICPNCCEQLVPNHKKLGSGSNWMVCPKCGLRDRKEWPSSKQDKMGYFIDRRKKINSGNEFKDIP